MNNKNHRADDFMKFKPRDLGESTLGNKSRKKGECENCGDDSQRLIKGKCPKCYSDMRSAKKRERKNPLFHPEPEKKIKKNNKAKVHIPVEKVIRKPRNKPIPAIPKPDPDAPYLTVYDIRRRPVGDFTKAQAEAFFNLK